jgi:Fuc2NAc and GlcNAc transferase
LKLEYLLSFTFGALGAWIVTCFGNTLSLLDHPNERSSHYIPTPKGGGIGILISFVFVCIFHKINFTFWFPLSIASIVGFCGDRIELSPKTRLFIQFLAAFALILGMDHSKFNIILLVLFSLPFAVFIVGTANFYNFMDGINGIAGITGLVGFGLLAFYASCLGSNSPLIALAICISLACLGFLPFNIPRAKVFMGDVGSILLGFVFAGMVVYFSKSFLDFICLSSFLFPFYADELTTMMVRLKNGENLTKAHRRHLYQLLANEYKIPHWKVSLGYGLFQFLIGISILLVKNMGLIMVVSTLVFYGCFFTICSFIFRKKTTHFA